MRPAIRVENLSKQYRIGSGRMAGGYHTLRETITSATAASWQWVQRPFRSRRPSLEGSRQGADTFYALKEISFEVEPGQAIGIIGHNGAGKSTLLKILSRIAEPTSGRAVVAGRMGSLLEVGTGFHPELSGRENIYLNGSILGMSHREIARKFDEIVAFSEIEPFLDTPVKRYSSGMYIRLAFAVAAHLEPEVLVVDEVLAVGDVEFQAKCVGKMQEVGRQGRTVLFVSHNMAAIQSLCSRGILLKKGQVATDAPVTEAVRAYLRSLEHTASLDLSSRTDRRGNGASRLTRIEIGDGSQAGAPVTLGRPVRISFHMSKPLPGTSCVFTIVDQYGCGLAKFNSRLTTRQDCMTVTSASAELVCSIEEWLLAPGRYSMDVIVLAGGETQDHLEAAVFFDVEPGPVREREPCRSTHDWKVAMPHRWSLARESLPSMLSSEQGPADDE